MNNSLSYNYIGEIPQWCYPSVSSVCSTSLKYMKGIDLPPCTLTMSNFSQYKLGGETWFSPPFYTDSGGYKLQLAVHANGVVPFEGTHVSMCVYLMKGEYDESLNWPFNLHYITVEVLNWISNYGHVHVIFEEHVPDSCNRVTMGERAVNGMCYQHFISHDNLQYDPKSNTQYLHNDLMCFRISEVAFPTGTIIRNSLY